MHRWVAILALAVWALTAAGCRTPRIVGKSYAAPCLGPTPMPSMSDHLEPDSKAFSDTNVPFNQVVARARSSGHPAILYFTADWCGYCRKMDRETLSNAGVQQRLRSFPTALYDVDTPEGRAVANRFGVNAFPTMVLVDGSGREVDQIRGARPPDAFLGKLARYP